MSRFVGMSPRPQPPPSESNGALSDADGVDGHGEDELVRPRRNPDRAPPSKVTDEVGERVAEVFGTFLEKSSALPLRLSYRADTS